MNILKLIAATSFIAVNKEIARAIGLHESIILGCFAGLQDYNGGEFYRKYEDIEYDTTLSKYQISHAIAELKSLNIITVSKRGIPSKNYYTINESNLLNYLKLRNFTPCDTETKELVVKKVESINSNKNTVTIIQDNNTLTNGTLLQKRFDLFWKLYDKKIGRDKCYKYFIKLKTEDQKACLENIPAYVDSKPDKQFRKDPYSFLFNRTWEDEIIIKQTSKPVYREGMNTSEDEARVVAALQASAKPTEYTEAEANKIREDYQKILEGASK